MSERDSSLPEATPATAPITSAPPTPTLPAAGVMATSPATAPEAAGVIHTDFQKGFIKAEVISFDDLVATGSVAEARAKGKARMEGKDYVMADGDVVEFRFNV